MGHRWVGELYEFNFSIKYRPGKSNADAAGLSRMPLDINAFLTQCAEELGQEVFTSAVQGVTGNNSLHRYTGLSERCECTPSNQAPDGGADTRQSGKRPCHRPSPALQEGQSAPAQESPENETGGCQSINETVGHQ